MSISNSQTVTIIVGALVVAFLASLVFYVTWLFIYRVRAKESPVKSFFRWLRDLIDLAFGL